MTIDRGGPGITRKVPAFCPVCVALGGWDKSSGQPRKRQSYALHDAMWQKCPYCGGTGYEPPAQIGPLDVGSP